MDFNKGALRLAGGVIENSKLWKLLITSAHRQDFILRAVNASLTELFIQYLMVDVRQD